MPKLPDNSSTNGAGGTAVLDPPAAATTYLADVPVELIDLDKENERPNLLVDLEALVESIRTIGLKERPTLVLKPDGRYLMRSGHRRFTACLQLGWKTMPAIVEPPPAAGHEQAIARIASNLCRLDVDAISLAKGIRSLLDAFPELTQEKIAAMLGKSQPTIANLVRLLDLPEEIITAIQEGKLTAGHGQEILRIRDPELGYGGATGKSAADMQKRKAQFCVAQGWAVATLREDVSSWLSNQEYYRKEAESQAKRKAEAAEARARGEDPQAAEMLKRHAEHEARQKKAAAEEARSKARTKVARDTIAATLAEEGTGDPIPLKVLRLVAIQALLSHQMMYGTGPAAVVERIEAAPDVDSLLRLLVEAAPNLIQLEWQEPQLRKNYPVEQYANRTWNLNYMIAAALDAQKLLTPAERKKFLPMKPESRAK